MSSRLLVSAVGLVDRDGRVLLATRPEGRDYPGLWEFPGGKVEDGETPEEALVRELKEELGISTETACLAPFSFATGGSEERPIVLLLFLCRKWSGQVSAQEGQKVAWRAAADLLDQEMPPIDRPLAAQLRDFLLGF